MSETMGEPGGSSVPTPDTDFKPLEIEVNSVADLGDALVKEADHFGDAAKGVKDQLVDPAGDQLGQYGDVPVGVDGTQETLRYIAGANTERMTNMGVHLDNVQTGLRNLGLITQAITSRYGSQDELNAADVGQVNEMLQSITGEKREA